jgi:hypothetical protein
VTSDNGRLTLIFAHGEPPPASGQEVIRWFDDNGEVWARGFSAQHVRWIDWRGLGAFAFAANATEVRVWPERHASREAIVEGFFRLIEPIVLQAQGWQALHAGAAAGPGGVVAFCGRSRSGKSTLSFAMQQLGWRQFADDALLWRLDPDGAMACPLSFTPRLRPGSRAHFANMNGQMTAPRPSVPAETPVAAVFLLRQDDTLSRPRVSSVPQARAFSELLPHAHCFDPEDPTHIRRLVESYLQLVARVPVFRLEYRPDLRLLGQVIDAAVEAAGIGPASSWCPTTPHVTGSIVQPLERP